MTNTTTRTTDTRISKSRLDDAVELLRANPDNPMARKLYMERLAKHRCALGMTTTQTTTEARTMAQDTTQAQQTFSVGDHVEGGRTGSEDYDHGYITDIDGEQVTVAWQQSLETTTQHASVLRPY